MSLTDQPLEEQVLVLRAYSDMLAYHLRKIITLIDTEAVSFEDGSLAVSLKAIAAARRVVFADAGS